MKKNSLAIFSCILLSVFLLTACVETNPNPSELPSSSAEPTPIIMADGIPQQPHRELNFESMVTFIQTVNADTFENGNFKDIIEKVRTEGYIIQPYFDNRPAQLRDPYEEGAVLICPAYENVKFPPEFMYHLISNEFWYRIEVIYIEEEFVPAAEANGYLGVRAFRDNKALELFKQKTDIKHEKVVIGGIEKNITITTYDDGISHGEFVWDEQYLIRIYGDVVENSSTAHTTINLDILPHLSFQKLPLTG